MKTFTKLTFLLFISGLLTNCGYNAAVTGAQAVYNRHSLQKTVDDNFTTMHAYHEMDRYGDKYKNAHPVIATFNDSILIAGQAPTAAEKDEIEQFVKKHAEGRDIYNYMEISNPTSDLVRTSDSWITAKIKSQLLAINEVDHTQFKVVTENGTVYLMGIITPEQAQIAVDVAQDTAGVQKVVKIFSYIRVTKA